MSDELTAVAAPSSAPTPGPAASGQAPSTPTGAENHTAATETTPSGQAPGTPKYRFKDQSEAERAHSELQRQYAKLGDPKSAAQRLALLQGLQNDPDFRTWAQNRLAKQEAGADDPETVRALQIVESVADRKARELLAPYAAQAEAVSRAAAFQALTTKYPEWREHEAGMVEALKAGVQAGIYGPGTKMSLPLLENLLHAARGADPTYAAKEHAKKLAQQRELSTQSTPGLPASGAAAAPVSSMRDAFLLAKRQLGMA
jgi:hypothetical protein